MDAAQVVVRVLDLRTAWADKVDEKKGYQGVEQGGKTRMIAAGWMIFVCIGLPIVAAYITVWINDRR